MAVPWIGMCFAAARTIDATSRRAPIAPRSGVAEDLVETSTAAVTAAATRAAATPSVRRLSVISVRTTPLIARPSESGRRGDATSSLRSCGKAVRPARQR